MYNRLFASTFTGSMVGSGAINFAVWAYAIANTNAKDETVELNPKLLGMILGEPATNVARAIEYLCAEDDNSRTKTERGRRLLREGEFLYRVVNFKKYSELANEAARRDYLRIAKQKSRSTHVNNGQQLSTPVNTCPTNVDVDVDVDVCSFKKRTKRTRSDTSKSQKAVPFNIKDFPPIVKEIYDAYPRNCGQKKTFPSIAEALSKIDGQLLLERVKLFAASAAGQRGCYTPFPWTWFRDERFNDDPAEWDRVAPPKNGSSNGTKKPLTMWEVQEKQERQQARSTWLAQHPEVVEELEKNASRKI